MRLPFLGTAGDVTEVRSQGNSTPDQMPGFFYSQNALKVRTTHHQPGGSLGPGDMHVVLVLMVLFWPVKASPIEHVRAMCLAWQWRW